MAKTNKDIIFDRIRDAFNELSQKAQVEIMAELYFDLDDYYKDEFLRETEND